MQSVEEDIRDDFDNYYRVLYKEAITTVLELIKKKSIICLAVFACFSDFVASWSKMEQMIWFRCQVQASLPHRIYEQAQVEIDFTSSSLC